MKKFAIIMATIACVLGLTACGSEKEYTQYEIEKMEGAKQYSTVLYIDYLSMSVDGTLDSMFGEINWDELTMEEVAYHAEGRAAYMMNNQVTPEIDGYGFYNALASFKANYKDIGSIISKNAEGTTAEIDGEQIIVTVPVECLKDGVITNADVELIYSNDLFMTLKSAAVNKKMSLGDKMAKGGLNTLMGMGTVFVVLILISLIISLFGVIPKIQKTMAESKAKKEAEKNATANGINNAVAQIEQAEANGAEYEPAADDTELVAVIAAAIAAYEGTSADGFVVRSIRKINR